VIYVIVFLTHIISYDYSVDETLLIELDLPFVEMQRCREFLEGTTSEDIISTFQDYFVPGTSVDIISEPECVEKDPDSGEIKKYKKYQHQLGVDA